MQMCEVFIYRGKMLNLKLSKLLCWLLTEDSSYCWVGRKRDEIERFPALPDGDILVGNWSHRKGVGAAMLGLCPDCFGTYLALDPGFISPGFSSRFYYSVLAQRRIPTR